MRIMLSLVTGNGEIKTKLDGSTKIANDVQFKLSTFSCLN